MSAGVPLVLLEVDVDKSVPIQYREFYDFPRMFLVCFDGEGFLFDGSFDDDLDDYPDTFRVFLLPALSPEELAGSWSRLPERATRFLGRVPTSSVHFDPTRRTSINAGIFRELGVGSRNSPAA